MLLTITTTYRPATDLGYLLHKHPERVQSFSLSFGRAHVFYPEVSDERCTVALLLDIDPVHLVRGRRGSDTLEQYVNDRSYVASSFLSVAIAEVFGTALNGRSAARQELAEMPLPLQAKLAVVPCRGGEGLLRRLFEPLGYTVTAAPHMLDEQHPDWGASPYFTVTLECNCRLRDLLTHLYVLIPVLDDDKHYFIGDEEVEKLLRHGKGWLENHPEKEQVAYRYLKHKRGLAMDAIHRLVVEDNPAIDGAEESPAVEEVIEERISLHQQRLGAVMAVLHNSGAKRILDLGCGEGRLLKLLLQDKTFEKILGLDVTYRDKRLEGYDAAAVVEVIEHLDPPRLAAFERVLFQFARPSTVAITTPNIEYNVKFETLPAGKTRHKDHRFEWTRAEFQTWSANVAERFGYTVRFLPIGPDDPVVGPPTQMGVFSRQQQ